MKYLIMIDTKYPYRSGESFLESEIKETANVFDKILIFPVDAVKGDQQTRKVDYTNVEDFVFENEKPFIRKGKSVVKSLFKMWTKQGTIKNRFFESVFEISAKAQAKKIITILDGYEFNSGDSVILYSYWFYIPARIAVELKYYFKNRGIEVTLVSRAHRFDIYENMERRPLPQRKLLLNEFNKVFACSKDGADYIREKYPEFSEKVNVGLLGTYDHGVGSYCNPSNFMVVSCSRVTDIKRVHLIAEAIHLLQTKGMDVGWTHIGDGPEMEKVAKVVDEKKIKSVNLLGAIKNTQVYDFYSKNMCSAFVNVSTSEGLPVSIMEVISFGIPVIATDVGGTREIVVDGFTGTLLPANPSVDVIANEIEKIYRMDCESYAELRKTTREFWLENFDARKNYQKFANDIQMF